VGLVGKSAGKYTVFLGGRLLGNRLNYIYQDLVPLEEITPTLVPVFACFKAKRREGETFGDFCARMGRENLLAFAGRFITAAAG
jgi:sulfite reductase (ferredoxin)